MVTLSEELPGWILNVVDPELGAQFAEPPKLAVTLSEPAES
jgi:hypothetical protein